MNIANYKRYRNKGNHLIKIAEKLHHQEMFQENKNNLTKTWSLLKNIIWKNKYTKSCGQFLDGNNTITDKAKISNVLNNLFTNIGVNLANQIPKSNHGPRKYLEGSYLHSMFFKPVLQTEVSTIINSLKNSAAGWNDLAPKQMKTVTKFISKPLTHLCNMSK